MSRNYLTTEQPQWLIEYDKNPTSTLNLSVIYQAPEYQDVDLTIMDAGMPVNHRHWLIKYLLPRAKVLQELNLEGCNIGDPGIIDLTPIVKENTTLRVLNLKDNSLSAKRAAKFIDAIEEENFSLIDIIIDEGDKDVVSKNKHHYESFNFETVTSMLQANESEKDKLINIQKRIQRITRFNKEVMKCIDGISDHLELIFHGEKGRSSGNKVSEFHNKRLDYILRRMPHLKSITFEKFYPYVPPMDIDRKWFESLDTQVQKEREEFDRIPDYIFHLESLTELNFFDCVDPYGRSFFERIPHQITCLQNLKKLTISQCGLKELDLDIGSVSYNKNSHENLERSIFRRIKSLEILSVPGNLLTKIPDTIGFCTTLKVLRLYNNQLRELPCSLINLSNLEELMCTGNMLQKIPLTLTQYCTNLSDLRILNQEGDRKNSLVRDDKNLLKIKESEEKTPRKDPFTLTINYMNKFINTATKIRLNKCKLMFVGDGAVGKTTTIKALKCAINKTKFVKEDELDNIATDGIDMQTLSVPAGLKHTPGHIGGNDCINFSCWDFAGQDVYSYTHQFFLSEKSIYLIGFNIENAIRPDGDPMNMSRVDYWLQSVSMRFPSSPIIIFGTHADSKLVTKDQMRDLHKKLTEKYVKNKKLKVVKVVFISNTTGKGVKDLLDEIKGICKNKKFAPILTIDREIPISWIRLEEYGKSISGLRVVPILTFDEWVKIAQSKANITSVEEVKKATHYLHEIGSLVWFDEEGLSDVVCIRPDFLADVFAAVISAKSGISTGILKHELLIHIWKSFPIYLYPYMLALLEKFEITHRLEGDAINNTAISSKILVDSIDSVQIDDQTEKDITELFKGSSIVPSLLPEFPPPNEEIEKVWPSSDPKSSEIVRVYQFDFIPNGFFSRLTVRLLHSQWNASILWRYGIILNKVQSNLFLLYDKDKKEITLRLRTRSEQHRLGPLVESMNALISDWLKNTEINVYIPFEIDGKIVKVDIKAIEKAASNGATYVTIENREVRLDDIAPDLAVVDAAGGNIDENDLHIEHKIGEGGYATVYKGTLNGTVVAVKRLTLKGGDNHHNFSEIFSEFRREVWLMKSLKHPNIVELKGICTKPSLTMVLEMMHGDLYNYIHQNSPLPVREIVKLALDVARGVQFMHTSQPPIIHRDLKSPNILIKREPDSEFPVAKIADFGLSRGLVWSVKLDDKAVENPLWLAPEILKKKPYTEKVDIYALGVILYELVTGLTFFWEISFMSKVEEKVIAGERPEIPNTVMPELRELIEKCWAQDMDDRPPINEVVTKLEKIQRRIETGEIIDDALVPPPPPDPEVPPLASESQVPLPLSESEVPPPPPPEIEDPIEELKSEGNVQVAQNETPNKKIATQGWVRAVISNDLKNI